MKKLLNPIKRLNNLLKKILFDTGHSRNLGATPKYLIHKYFDLGDIANSQIVYFAKSTFTSGYCQFRLPIKCGWHSYVIYGFDIDGDCEVGMLHLRDDEDEAIVGCLYDITVEESLCIFRELSEGNYNFYPENKAMIG